MLSVKPLDHILYLHRGDYFVAKVDIVRADGVTAFPWTEARGEGGVGRWSRGRRRIKSGQIVTVLHPRSPIASLAIQLNAWRNQRDAKVMIARSWFNEKVRTAVDVHGKETA